MNRRGEMEKNTILEIRNMNISFSQYQKGTKQTKLPVIRDLSLTVHQGEMVAVVGSSGSGKSLLAHGVMGILPIMQKWAERFFTVESLLQKKRICALRGKEIVMVPQSTSYLDPLMKVGTQICKGKKDPERKKKLDRDLQTVRVWQKKFRNSIPLSFPEE